MKKHLIILIICIICLSIGACGDRNTTSKQNNTQDNSVEDTDDNITTDEYIKYGDIEVTSTEVRADGIKLIIKNTSEKEYVFGEAYQLEKKTDDKWELLDTIIEDYGFIAIGNVLPAKESVKDNIKWDWLYGELKPGEYRICKEITRNITIKYEFTIE